MKKLQFINYRREGSDKRAQIFVNIYPNGKSLVGHAVSKSKTLFSDP